MFDNKTLLITGGTGSFGNTVLKRFLDLGMETMPGTPEQFRAFARSESKRWGPIIRAAGITLD